MIKTIEQIIDKEKNRRGKRQKINSMTQDQHLRQI